MAGKLEIDEKTWTVKSADLAVDYDGQLSVLEKDLARVRNIAGMITRTMKSMGLNVQKLKEAELKKVGAQPNAATLIKQLENAQIDVTMSGMAWSSASDNMNKAEAKAMEELFAKAAKPMAERIAAINKEAAALAEEMKLLKQKKDGLLADIKQKTRAPRQAFDNKYKTLRKSLEDLAKPFQDLNVRDADRYIKKK